MKSKRGFQWLCETGQEIENKMAGIRFVHKRCIIFAKHWSRQFVSKVFGQCPHKNKTKTTKAMKQAQDLFLGVV
jgi:hypothetical protein